MGTLGWMNENFDFNEDAIMSDVASLDPVVTGPLFDGHEDCVADVMDDVENHECASPSARTSRTLCSTPPRRLPTTSASFISLSRVAWISLRLLLARNKKGAAGNICNKFDQILVFDTNLTNTQFV